MNTQAGVGNDSYNRIMCIEFQKIVKNSQLSSKKKCKVTLEMLVLLCFSKSRVILLALNAHIAQSHV